jgi:prepilin-type N-terminal cleavage/methylation domain-containing protein
MPSRKGFTLVEVLTVVIIFGMLSSLMVADLRNGGRLQRLSAAADELASRIKQAQGLAYSNTKQEICSTDNLVCRSGSSCDAGYPTNCVSQYISRYGVALMSDGTNAKYMVGADFAGLGNYVAAEAVPMGTVTLRNNIVIDSVTPAHVAGTYDLVYVYDSANASPFISCSSNCTTRIVLRDTVLNKTKTVVVEKRTGIVSIE